MKEGPWIAIKTMNKCKKESLSIAILCALVLMTLAFSFDFRNYDVTVPLTYWGTDDFTVYKNAKMLSDGSGWIHETDRLGAPFGAEYYDFMPDSLMNVDNLFLKFFSLFSKNPVTTVNMTVFFLFFLIALTAYYALRKFDVRNDFAIMGALIFDFMYYHFTRLTVHFSLSSYEFVPIAILLCVWFWQDARLLRFGREFMGYKKNYLVILFCFLIANNGIAYYPFFTCMFLMITGVSGVIKRKKVWPLTGVIKAVIFIVFFMLISLIPSIIYQVQNGANFTERLAQGAELYALKIFQLLVPYKDYGWGKLREVLAEYYASFTYTEAVGSYLGLMAGVGFLILLLGVFRNDRKVDCKKNNFRLFVELNIFAVLFATAGGFSSIFANFVTSLIRGANRISIFIAFISIAAVCILISSYMKKRHKRKWFKFVVYGVFVVGICISLFDQIPSDLRSQTDVFVQNQKSDMEFIQRIEEQLPEGSMIYQMPYHVYPEGGAVNSMQDYHLLIGFLYSDTLKWSYGGSGNREGDLWHRSVAQMDLKDTINTVKEKGFAGIYVDMRAYVGAEAEFLQNSINVELGHIPEISENGNLYFWKF